MGSLSGPFSIQLDWSISWPLYVVFPLTTLGFTAFYFAGPYIWPKTMFAERYEKMSELNKACWRQNCCALVHSVTTTLLCVAAIATDSTLRNTRPLHAVRHARRAHCNLCAMLRWHAGCVFRLTDGRTRPACSTIIYWAILHLASRWVSLRSRYHGHTTSTFGRESAMRQTCRLSSIMVLCGWLA